MKKILLYILPFVCLGLFAQTSSDYKYLNLSSSPFKVDENYLSKHDIVYLSPTQLEAEGFPMGNGNIGGMVWTNDNGIELQLNKNDLWAAAGGDEGDVSVLKHAARLKIDFGVPVFSWIHLKQFDGRLSLQKGESTYEAETAYSTTYIRTWPVQGKNVWVVECDNLPGKSSPNDLVQASISLERLGSRSFYRWYAGDFPNDVAAGLGITNSKVSGHDLLIGETGEGLHFAVACRVLKETNTPTITSRHRIVQTTDKQHFVVLVSVVTSRECNQPERAAQKLLDETEQIGIDSLRKKKDEWYKNFWSNSFVKLGNDYLENIYYLRRYLMAAGSQGEFPVAFNGGLWRWNRDVMNWVTPHHWNTQQQYWGLGAQNDCQLMLPYLTTYYNMIPYGEALAKEKGALKDALLISEAHCFTGEQTSKERVDMKNDYTPASQIASLFWDYYAFTGDKVFLRNKAYLFMKESANFYLQKLQWDAAKKEFYLNSSLYESASIDYAKNTISDRNCIEQLFSNCIKAATILKVDKAKIKKWNYVLKHLWSRTYQPFEQYGETIAPVQEYYTSERYTPWIWACGGSIAFPANLIGIDNKDTREGKAVMNLVRARKDANAHYPLPEIAARMGMGNEALQYILNGINIHQMYPQGLMHNVTGYPNNLYNLNSIHDMLGHTYTIRSQSFFQCGMEAMSNYATAVNEMMLQSNEDKIRVFPAIPTAWDSVRIAFTLLARGSFLVSAERDSNACVTQVGIKSLKGNICRIQNPWKGKTPVIRKAGESKQKITYQIKPDGSISFPTKANEEYIIQPDNKNVLDKPFVYSANANQGVKYSGTRMLGKPSGWNDQAKQFNYK